MKVFHLRWKMKFKPIVIVFVIYLNKLIECMKPGQPTDELTESSKKLKLESEHEQLPSLKNYRPIVEKLITLQSLFL